MRDEENQLGGLDTNAFIARVGAGDEGAADLPLTERRQQTCWGPRDATDHQPRS